MANYKTIRDVDLKDQVVLMRADYNVPIANGKITDVSRIKASLPTIKHILKHQASKLVIMSHLGRPEGRVVPELSLKPVAQELQKLLPKTTVQFVSEVSGPEVDMTLSDSPEGGILLLENLRFYPEEMDNSVDFMREIVDSTHASLFVQDGFAVVHRAHASTVAVTEILPAVAGLLVDREVQTLGKVLDDPDRPLAILVGGAKVADKQPLVDKFAPIADQIIVGGRIAIGDYKAHSDNIYVCEDFDTNAEGDKLDIGPISTAKMVELLMPAKTIVWSGTLGRTEDPAYATASLIAARTIGEKTDITSVICGGDTMAFVNHVKELHPELKYTLISTGGSAALAFLSGEQLPGLMVL